MIQAIDGPHVKVFLCVTTQLGLFNATPPPAVNNYAKRSKIIPYINLIVFIYNMVIRHTVYFSFIGESTRNHLVLASTAAARTNRL